MFKIKIVNSELVSIFKNSIWLFVDKIGRQGLNFLLTVYIARYLGVELFGLWSYAIAMVSMFSFFSTLGIYNQLTRDLVKHPNNSQELLGSAFFLKLVGGFITLVTSFVMVLILKPDANLLQILVLIVSLGYVFQSLDVVDFFYQSRLRGDLILISRLTAFIFFSILKIGFIYFQYPLVYFAIAQSCELLFSGCLLLLLYKKLFNSPFQWKIKFGLTRRMLMESAPILFAEIAIIVYMRIDQVMIGEIIGEESLGIYSAAVKLSEIWYLFPAIICGSAFPSIIKAQQDNYEMYLKKLQLLYDVLLWLGIAIAIVVSLSSKQIVTLTFGQEFLSASSILIVHVWTCIFVFIGYASNQQLVIQNSSVISLYRTLVGMTSNVILNFILIPKLGSVGAAYATLVAQCTSNFLSNLIFSGSRNIFWMTIKSLNILRWF